MVQKTRKTLGVKKIMVYNIPPGGEVNHTWSLANEQIKQEMDENDLML